MKLLDHMRGHQMDGVSPSLPPSLPPSLSPPPPFCPLPRPRSPRPSLPSTHSCSLLCYFCLFMPVRAVSVFFLCMRVMAAFAIVRGFNTGPHGHRPRIVGTDPGLHASRASLSHDNRIRSGHDMHALQGRCSCTYRDADVLIHIAKYAVCTRARTALTVVRV